MEKVAAYMMLPVMATYFATMRKYHRTAALSAAIMMTGALFFFGADLAAHKFTIAVFDLFAAVLFALMSAFQSHDVIVSRRATQAGKRMEDHQ